MQDVCSSAECLHTPPCFLSLSCNTYRLAISIDLKLFGLCLILCHLTVACNSSAPSGFALSPWCALGGGRQAGSCNLASTPLLPAAPSELVEAFRGSTDRCWAAPRMHKVPLLPLSQLKARQGATCRTVKRLIASRCRSVPLEGARRCWAPRV